MSEQVGSAAVARAAMAAVQGNRREAWLSLFAAQARVEDPVGHLPPIEGRDGLERFWDQVIATLDSTKFEVTRQWETADEAVLLATVSVVGAGGAGATYDGAFVYAIDEEGKIASLRAFWDFPAVVAALTA
jgi:ketosteroid isomerase-like protein